MASTLQELIKSGKLPKGDISDVLSTPAASNFLPVAMEKVVREAALPPMVLSPLFRQMTWKATTNIIDIPQIGEVRIGDVGEGQEYPRVSASIGPGKLWAVMGKYGGAVDVTLEQIQNSEFDLFGEYLRKLGNAIGRYREVKAIQSLEASAVPLFDNVNPGRSLNGSTTGRGSDFTANGTLNMDDLMTALTTMLQLGHNPTIIAMNPQAFSIFLRDQTMRDFLALRLGGDFFNMWSGDARFRTPGGPLAGGILHSGGEYITPGTPSEMIPSEQMKAEPRIPDYAKFNFAVLLSPFIEYNPITKRTDIFLIDPNAVGYWLVKELATVERWDSPPRDVMHVKVREQTCWVSVAPPTGVGKLASIYAGDRDWTSNVSMPVRDVSEMPTIDTTKSPYS